MNDLTKPFLNDRLKILTILKISQSNFYSLPANDNHQHKDQKMI